MLLRKRDNIQGNEIIKCESNEGTGEVFMIDSRGPERTPAVGLLFLIRSVFVFFPVLFFCLCVLCMTDIEPRTPNGLPLIAVVGLVLSVSLAVFTVKHMTKT